MTQSVVQETPLKQLPDRVMVAGQLTSIGAKAFAAPDDLEPGRQLLSLFSPLPVPTKARLRKPYARLGIPPMQATF
jgi:hypothetical protein